MLSSLLASAFIIYLYRKLKAEAEPQAAASGESHAADLGSALDALNQRLVLLDSRLAAGEKEETAR